MSDEEAGSISVWIQAAKVGNEDAVQNLFERYFYKLAEISRTKVQRKRRVEDEEDAALETMNQVLAGMAEGKFPQVIDRTSLWPLLVDIVIKISRKQYRRQAAKKRNDVAVGGESVFTKASDGQLNIADFSPDEVNEENLIELADTVKILRASLGELERKIFDLKLELRSNREIAEMLSEPASTIDRRVRTVIMPRLESLLQFQMKC